MNRFAQKSLVLLAFLCLVLPGIACAQDEGDTAAPEGQALDSLEKRASYALGLNMAQSMKAQAVPIDIELLIEGLKDAFTGAETRLTDQEVQQTLQEFQQMMMQRQQEARATQGTENQQAAEAFFAENGAKEGVVTTESGLQYMVMQEGDGPKPSATDRVTVHYQGTLLDGTKFDSSYDRGQPATFPVNGVIQGWQEAVPLMSVGSKYKLWIPADLAYGANGQGPIIGPNAALVFEVELLSIEGQGEDQAAEGQEGNGE